MANGEVGIVPRDLTLAGIRSYPLLGRRRVWHYNRAQYSGGALYMYNRQLRKFIAKLSSKLNYLTNYITISGYLHYHMRDHEHVNPIDVMT